MKRGQPIGHIFTNFICDKVPVISFIYHYTTIIEADLKVPGFKAWTLKHITEIRLA
jgi:hypothetical protein